MAENVKEDFMLEFDGNPPSDVELDEKKVQLRYASIILEPKVGCNTQYPALKLAYTIVEKEVRKVTFKYGLANWKLRYCMRVDSTLNNCYIGGNPCVLLQMPYATYNIDDARENLISYCTEVMILLHLEYAVMYFDAQNAYGITCNFDENGEIINSDVEDLPVHLTATCILNAGIVPASIELQRAIMDVEALKDMRYYTTPVYVYTSMYPSAVPNSLLFSCNVQNHCILKEAKKYENSVRKVIKDSMLSFTNLTVI